MNRLKSKHLLLALVVLGPCAFITRISFDKVRANLTRNDEDAQIKSRLMARSERMHDICAKFPEKRRIMLPMRGRLLYISEKYKLSYCRVAKVGSTFWTQIFMALEGVQPVFEEDDEVNSVFDMPRIETHGLMKEHTELTMDFSDKRLKDTTSFLVARNPYSRLFSSYIDQVYLPTKWKNAGKMKKPSSQCGNDVTFEEFLVAISNYILLGYDTDLHWAPIFSICMPCESRIDLLAKQETFDDDAEQILRLVGVKKAVINNVKKASKEQLIDTSIRTLLHHYIIRGHQAKTGCITELQLARKLWTAFQIQGYIHDNSKFPADLFQNVHQNNTETILRDAILKANTKNPISLEERSKQRQNWKLWFWRNISNKTIELIQSAFYEDFFVFDYRMDLNDSI